MHCIRIRFESYKRLADASCNTDARILAFVGSNESGKSSMLEGLVWLTDGQDDALPAVYENRSREVADASVVVEAIFELSPDDLGLLDGLDLAQPPRTFTYQKWKNGKIGAGADPTPRRNPAPFEQAAAKVASAQRRSHAQFAMLVDDSDEDSETFNDVAERVLAALRDPDATWAEEVVTGAQLLVEWLNQPSTTGRAEKPRGEDASRLLRIALGKVEGTHPRIACRSSSYSGTRIGRSAPSTRSTTRPLGPIHSPRWGTSCASPDSTSNGCGGSSRSTTTAAARP